MVDNLKKWFEYLTIPRPELGNMPICPFAKAAITNQEYTIEETNLDDIASQINKADVQVNKVCIFYLTNYEIYEVETLEAKTEALNEIAVGSNKVVLESDPREPFIVNGVTTNFPDCYIWIVQDLADLISKSNNLKLTNYYNYWIKEQIEGVVTWRNRIKI